MSIQTKNQNGSIIVTEYPKPDICAYIYTEEQRKAIKRLIRHGFNPDHTSVGEGKLTKEDNRWRTEKYRGKFGVGFKMITWSPLSHNFNHLTYFIKPQTT